jgi:basic membrane protein A and related proteins
MHKRLPGARVIAVVAAVALVAAGAAYATGALRAAKVTKVAIATPAKNNDYGWNQQGVKAARAAAAAYQAKLTVITNIGYDKTDTVLTQLAKSGANFIIAHASGYDTIAGRVAQRYKVPVMTYDDPKQLVKGYVSNITTSSQEASYLAGILAAKSTKAHKVGIVISASDPNWYKMSGGFAAGFRSVDKTSKIFFATVSPTGYDDAAGGKRVANSVIAQGADVIFAMGDGATFGYLQAIETAKNKVWFIGDIGDLTPIDKNHIFLSSVLWDFTGAYKSAIGDINNGTYGTHGYNLSLKNGGVSLLKTRYISGSLWSTIQKARAGIISGSVKVPDVSTKGAVLKLLK